MTVSENVAGLVIAAHGRRGLLEAPDGRHLPYAIRGRRLQAVCGDRVRYEKPAGADDWLITAIEPRHNELSRITPRGSGGECIAANLTRLIAVCAPRPEPDWFLIDRYLCAAELLGCHGTLLWNKADLAPPQPELDAYRRLGYTCLAVSAAGATGLDALRHLMSHETSVLVGQSGVGKSSLINALVVDAAAVTGELSAARTVGRHTTSATLMYDVGDGGRLIDTPGVRDFLPAMGSRRPDLGFVELRALAPRCRFADCSHVHEPGCAVKAALEKREIAARRYASYRRLLDSYTARSPP